MFHMHWPRLKSIFLLVTVILWLSAVAAGMRVLTDYSNRPGDVGQPRPQWPPGSRILRSKNLPTIVMFAHPRCPCTRASISELAVLMTQCERKLSAHVVFFQPEATREDWAQTDLWTSASIIPGVEVFADHGGKEFRRFGAATSGQVLLYDSGGQLIFQGGITSARGHSGDNLGRNSIVGLLSGTASKGELSCCSEAPVFGCPLFD